ncbi:MAG: hypothetical protein HRT52_11685 [Colwellia sp.]|nr:hypothetical protein [Colwellia sp.]NQZ81667.1 hypothetical protein [Colwellia sp.]
MSKLTTNKVFSFSQAIAAQIKEDCPQINISSNKLSTIIAKEVGSSPAELDLLLRLHNKYLESNCGPGLSLIGVFYNQEENEADIALLKVGKNKIEEIRIEKKVDLTGNDKRTKKIFKLINNYSDTMGFTVGWLNASNAATLDQAKDYCHKVVKKTPPNNCINIETRTFSETFKNEKDRDSFNFIKSKNTAQLGIYMVTHSHPYLPLQISYYVGNFQHPDFRNIYAISLNNKPSNIGDFKKLELEGNTFPRNSSSDTLSVKLNTMHLFTQSLTKTSVLFDILDVSFNHNFEEIRETYTYNSQAILGYQNNLNDKKEVTSQPLQAIVPNEQYSYSNVKPLFDYDMDKNPQKYQTLTKGFKFESDFFSVNHNLSHTPIKIERKTHAKNILDKALELKEQFTTPEKLSINN